jgi:hypothetical protein
MARKGTKRVRILFHGRRSGADKYSWGRQTINRGDSILVPLEDHWLELVKRGDAEVISEGRSTGPAIDEDKLP